MPEVDPNNTVFISYRRSVHPHLSLLLFKDLKARGFDPFRDSDTMGAGEFDKIILNQIAARTHFVVLLSYGSLDRCIEPGDWLRREIEHAIALDRNIVPVLVDGFKFEDAEQYLTGKLDKLKIFQGQPLHTEELELYEVGIDKLANQKLKRPIYFPELQPTPRTEKAQVEQIIQNAVQAPSPTQKELTSEQLLIQALGKIVQGKWTEALIELNTAIVLNPEQVTAYMSRSICFSQKGDFENAIADANEVVRLSPLDPHSYQNLASVLVAKNDLPAALIEIKKAFDIKPDFGAGFMTRSEIRKQMGDTAGSKADYDKAIALMGGDLARISVAFGAIAGNTVDQAISYFTKAIEYDPNYIWAYRKRADALSQKGNMDEAIADMTKAIRLQPDDPILYNNRGVIRENKSQIDEAIEDYSEAIRLNSDYAIAYSNRAAVHIKKGNFDEAIADCDEAIRLNPQFAQAYANRGSGRHNKGDIEGAIADYTTAISLQSNNAKMYYDRGLFYYLKNDINQALQDFDESIHWNPNIAEGYIARGVIHFLQKQFDMARLEYQKASEIDPNYKYTIAGLALTNHALGNPIAGRQLWMKLVQQDKRYKDADWVGKEFYWKPPMIEAARKLISELEI